MPKIAEALVERKALHTRLSRLQNRLATNAKVQEGELPAEAPGALLDEARSVIAQIKDYVVRINETNQRTVLPGNDGLTLMQAIAERDRLAQERDILERLNTAAQVVHTSGYGVTRNEIKWKPTVNVGDLQKEIDEVAKQYRLLDTRIQEANWSTELFQN